MEDLDMRQMIHRAAAPPGRFAQTAAEQAHARCKHREVVAWRERYRRAHALTTDLTEQLGQLSTDAAGPSERLDLQESARQSVSTIVRVLTPPMGAVPVVRRTSRDPHELDEWVQLLDELLTDAQLGYDGAHGRALALATSIAVGVDQLVRHSSSRGRSR
jgi:hypothetical protein